MLSEESLSQVFSTVTEDFVILSFTESGEENFDAVVQCKVASDSYDLECKKIILKFSSVTCTNWIARKRFAKSVRFAFRKVYFCHLNSSNKCKNTPRDLGCRAAVDFKFKLVNRHTIKNDRLLKSGKNVIVKINFNHSHAIRDESNLKYLRFDADLQVVFRQYFESGMTPPVAKQYHDMQFVGAENGGGTSIENANPHPSPNMRQIRHLFSKWKKEQTFLREDYIDVIKQKSSLLIERDVHVELQENRLIVELITPLMKRTHLTSVHEKVVFVESGTCEGGNLGVTFFFVPHKVGVLPIGCVLHSLAKVEYSQAFQTLKKSMETIIEKPFTPQVVITSDISLVRHALIGVYKECRFFTASYKLVQDLWRLLGKLENKINVRDRLNVMNNFQLFTQPANLNLLEGAFKKVTSLNVVKDNMVLEEHINELWNRRTEWSLLYLRGINLSLSKFTELSLRIFKDVVLNYGEEISCSDWMDYVSGDLEVYQVGRLMNCAKMSRTSNCQFVEFMKNTKFESELYENGEDVLHTLSEEDPREIYTIMSDLGFCNCPYGNTGIFCKHVCSVEKKVSRFADKSDLTLSLDDKIAMIKLALGDERAEEFIDFKLNETKTTFKIEPNEYGMLQSNNVFDNVRIISENDTDSPDHHMNCVTELRSEFARLANILEAEFTPMNSLAVKRFIAALERLKSPQAVLAFMEGQANYKLMTLDK